jgi:exopolyphosphatase/guanosine-5'-triphosphate,3'-diphosphate pyrophosphatase
MPKRRGNARGNVVAVIDIGSNSGRVTVFERDTSSHLHLLAGSRAALRLVHDVDTLGELRDATMARTTEALRDFRAIAAGAGAKRIVAVATEAMRDAANGALFAERVRRELGIRLEIIGGPKEAQYGFAGAIRGLAASNGLLFDLGGGSLQISQFARRGLATQVSLPLGALRVSEKFLESDPPTGGQLRRLRNYVRHHLKNAQVTRLAHGDRLVGTGGTLRNLAKIDRQPRRYPIGWLHGYELAVHRLEKIVARLASIKEKRRDDVPGLSAERGDSIVGGAIVIHTLAEFVRAGEILVSGQGVREGVALSLLEIPVGSPETVKEASLSSLVSRFDGWTPEAAARRRSVAASLQRALEPRAPVTLVQAIDTAARALDMGRTLDVVNRHRHVADILLSTELTGFAHHEAALASAIVRRAGDRHAEVLALALAHDSLDLASLDRAAVIVALADEIEARCPHGRPITVECRIGRTVTLSVPLLPSWLAKDLDKRFERAFGRSLVVRH